jgi:hypothetical protein
MTPYLDRMPSTSKKALELQENLDAAKEKVLVLAEQCKIQVEELDLPVHVTRHVSTSGFARCTT